MNELTDYFKNKCKIDCPKVDNLCKHETELLINAMNNANIKKMLNNQLYGQFYNCLGNMMMKKKLYNDAKIYYSMAIKKGYLNAITNLGNYYYCAKKNYNKAEKYYLTAIEHDDPVAMNNLGARYYKINKNYAKAKNIF